MSDGIGNHFYCAVVGKNAKLLSKYIKERSWKKIVIQQKIKQALSFMCDYQTLEPVLYWIQFSDIRDALSRFSCRIQK
jgi:hypothetical protein